MSNRGNEWAVFQSKVWDHVENYTIPQYGDFPDDQITDWTAEDCVRSINKRCARFGRNSRPDQALLDLLKIAHEACLAYSKLIKGASDDK